MNGEPEEMFSGGNDSNVIPAAVPPSSDGMCLLYLTYTLIIHESDFLGAAIQLGRDEDGKEMTAMREAHALAGGSAAAKGTVLIYVQYICGIRWF